MNILTILILSSVVNAGIFDVFRRDSCDLSTCQSAATALSQKCDVDEDLILSCLCDDMPDSFFQNLHDCAVGCGENQDEDIPDASGIRSVYCAFASETGSLTGFDGFGGFGGFGESTDDDTETINLGTETINLGKVSDGQFTTSESKTTDEKSKTTGTTDSKSNDSKTTNSETSSTETSSSESSNTANSAAIVNSSLISFIALMIAMLM